MDVGFSYVRAWYRPGFVYRKAGVGVPVVELELRIKRVGFVATFRLVGKGKSVLNLVEPNYEGGRIMFHTH